MAHRHMTMCFLGLAIVTMLFHHASAQTGGCMTTIISMAPCLGFITGNSSTPSSSCCSALASVVKSQPQCLCAVLNGGASSLGVTINNTRALELPGACKVQTPPVSACNAVNGAPAAAPTVSPTPATPAVGAPVVTPTPATPSVPIAPAPEAPATPKTPANPTPETPATPATPATSSVPSVTPSGSKTTPSTTTTTTTSQSSSSNSKSATIPLLFISALASFTLF